jgi:class 3 adenylate cyclase
VESDQPGGRTQRLTLGFVDAGLEQLYQQQEGVDGRVPAMVTAGAAAVLWLLAAFVLPQATDLPANIAMPVPLVMAVISLAGAIGAYFATTLDPQHLILSLLTSANGLVIMLLAAQAGVFPGYAVSAIMLLFAYGFVSRTRFIFAVLRTVIIGAGFFYFVLTYPGPASLLIDAFFFVAAAAGTLLALRLLERSRRRVFHQQRVIGEQARALELEKDKSDRLLLNVLPEPIMHRLREGETSIADDYPSVTVLFADIVGFTPLASGRPAAEMVALLDDLFSRFDEVVAERGLEKIKTIGDAYMAAGGLTDPDGDHALRVVEAALAMQAVVADNAERWPGVELRIGVHTGPAAGGIIGRQKFAFDLWGETINFASRLEQHGLAGRVHISSQTWQLVRDHFACELRPDTQLRGVGDVATYLVVGRQAVPHRLPATPPTAAHHTLGE